MMQEPEPHTKKRKAALTAASSHKGSTISIAEKPRGGPGGRNSMCVGCGGQIHDQYILRVAPDLEWHASCLKCAECQTFLDESCTCFVREGKTYCKRDYVRLFGTKCAKCSQGFSKNDFVMRARNKIFHIDCFRCVACSRQLIPGDEFALRDDGLFCKADNDIVERSAGSGSQHSPGENSDIEDSKQNILNNNNDSKNSLHSSGQESPNSTSSTTPSSGEPTNRRKKDGHKTTRVRTVLSEKQLHTLRTCYNANPRPDALMKEQLVEMTSLSPRVIRVWFQNKRCKDKKRSIALKAMQQMQQEKWELNNNDDDDDMHEHRKFYIMQNLQQGVPMVASSPVRHEPPPGMQGNPVEVQSYQAPWKALSEFAMGGDMEQPPFQQLVSTFGDSTSDDDSSVTLDDPAPGATSMVAGGLLGPPPPPPPGPGYGLYHHHHHHHHPGPLLHPHHGAGGPPPLLMHDLDAKC